MSRRCDRTTVCVLDGGHSGPCQRPGGVQVVTTTTTELDRPTSAVPVHEPHGFVALSAWAGTDLDIVNAARVSFHKQSQLLYRTTDGEDFEDYDDADDHQLELCNDAPDTPDPESFLNEADAGLINYLLRNRHGTPFEMVWCRWHISAPIFVFREWHRHRIASINEMSGRYVELRPRFYLPDDDHVRVQKGKPGHYTFEPVGGELGTREAYEALSYLEGQHGVTWGDMVRGRLSDSYAKSYRLYESLMKAGVAKEIARACLPVGIYSEMYWACNLRALLNFLSLRNHPRALQEIRDYAAVMENVLAEQMPVTHAAFVANDRIAP